jgi:hypothetical protein
MQKYCSQGWLSKVAMSGILISLFSIAVFPFELNSVPNNAISPNVNYFASNSRGIQAVCNIGVECIYLAEPVSGNISKTLSSFKEGIPLFYASSCFCMDNLYPAKYVYFSDNIPRKSLRQVCLVLDIPPPIL